MLAKKPVGRNAAAVKYDLLSAMAVLALSGEGPNATSLLRLSVLITTRYNWQTGLLAIGRTEIARVWSVNERTVKRELARFRDAGWLRVRHPGVRGRVTVYELDLDRLLADTRPVWPLIGPDFESRMLEGDSPAPAASAKVVPFPRPQAAPAADGLWARVLGALHARDPMLSAAWFARLTEAGRAGDTVVLEAPSRFIADYVATHHAGRILAGYAQLDPSVRAVALSVAGEG